MSARNAQRAECRSEPERGRADARIRVVIALLAVAVATGCSDSSARDELPRFESASCPTVAPFTTKGLPTPPELATSKCGWLFVPESRAKANGPTIRLAVVIVPSVRQPAAPDPVVHLAGGPGGSSLIELQSLTAAGVNRERDLILMSQRGTLFADPELTCPDLDGVFARSIELPLDSPANHEAHRAGFVACRDRLARRGVDFGAYDTVESAADFADLRRALGIAQWNVFGVSYGTYLAQTLMYQHPEGIRTVTLDSVEPLVEADMATTAARNAREAFDNLFGACAAQPSCAARYPDLEATFTRLVNALEAAPLASGYAPSPGDPLVRVVLDGGAIVNGIIDTSFHTGEFAQVPAWIDRLARGDGADFARARGAPLLIPPGILAYGMATSMVCSGYFVEDSDASVLAQGKRSFPRYPDSVLSPALHFTDALSDCRIFGVPATPKELRTPRQSAIPTLLLSGTFDAVTPPGTAVTAAETLSRATVLAFAGVGHAVVQSSPCAAEVFASFLDDPGAPGVACVGTLTPPVFATGG